MSLTQRLSAAALLIAVVGIGASPAAQVHSNHHHHFHKKQKAYNNWYWKGYKKAINHSYHPAYVPVYVPVRRRFRPYKHGTRINPGIGFNL